jgi:hypothetical protein
MCPAAEVKSGWAGGGGVSSYEAARQGVEANAEELCGGVACGEGAVLAISGSGQQDGGRLFDVADQRSIGERKRDGKERQALV